MFGVLGNGFSKLSLGARLRGGVVLPPVAARLAALRATNPYAIYNPMDRTSMFRPNGLGNPTSDVHFVEWLLDVNALGGKTAAEGIAALPELITASAISTLTPDKTSYDGAGRVKIVGAQDTSNTNFALRDIKAINGRYYSVTVDVAINSGGGFTLRPIGTKSDNIGQISTTGKFSYILQAKGSDDLLSVIEWNNTLTDLDARFSAKLLPIGQHWQAPTTSQCPTAANGLTFTDQSALRLTGHGLPAADVVLANKTIDARGVLFWNSSDKGRYFGTYQSDSSGTTDSNVGTVSSYVGNLLIDNIRDSLRSALATGNWTVARFETSDLALLDPLQMGAYSAYPLDGAHPLLAILNTNAANIADQRAAAYAYAQAQIEELSA